MIESTIFYLFALLLVFSGVMTVTVRNPVSAVLFLILSFASAAGVFLTLEAEFLSLIMLIVYVGALAVLFLFVVMMLHVGKEDTKAILRREGPVALAVGAALLVQMLAVTWFWPSVEVKVPISALVESVPNIKALGLVLYTNYGFAFQLCGIALLVAMIGAIVLTLRPAREIKRQNHMAQLDVDARDVVELCRVKTGEGVL